MHTCIYSGSVAHVRREPVVHRFRYSIAFAYLDLDEAHEVLRACWLTRPGRAALSFRANDHPMSVGSATTPSELADLVRGEVGLSGRPRPLGPVRLLTQLRHCGAYFSPLNLFFCYAESGGRIEAIVAEVSNTPWNERKRYVLDARQQDATGSDPGVSPGPAVNAGDVLRFRHSKDFHVSPFMGIAAEYFWRITPPEAALKASIRCREAGRKPFDATMKLSRRSWNPRNLASLALRFPLANVQILAAIYWQAFRLWTKRCPYVPHPRQSSVRT